MTPSKDDRIRLGIFAKYWEPGRVKTRLASSIGADQAAEVYQAFVRHLLRRFRSPEDPAFDPQLVYSPKDREPEFVELATLPDEKLRWSFHDQGDGNLGERMQRFFQRTFDDGIDKAVIVGTDSPTLPISYIGQTRWLLNTHEVVLGPSEDGGYYLVASRHQVPPIFSNISWSTPSVWPQTVACLQHHRVKFAVLPTWYDVDEKKDLDRLRREIDVDHERNQSKPNVEDMFATTTLRGDLERILEN